VCVSTEIRGARETGRDRTDSSSTDNRRDGESTQVSRKEKKMRRENS
jgi:hypothetical protein